MSKGLPEPKQDLRTSAWFSQPGVVYFVSAGADCEGCKSVKIGVTLRERLLKRLNAIQSSNHTQIRLLRVIECDTMQEAEQREVALHTRFAPDARVNGTVGYEWFRASRELMEVIERQGTLPGKMVNKPACLNTLLKLYA